MSSAAYSQSGNFSLSEIIGRVQTFAEHSDHTFWADDLSVRDTEPFLADRLHGSRHVTDTYLLALAVARGGCLVTFDRGLRHDRTRVRTRGPERAQGAMTRSFGK